MKPFLFEYEVIFGKVHYTLVYAENAELAYKKINDIVNPTAQQVIIKLATIF